MPTTERVRDRGRRRAARLLANLADEFREKRLATGMSQRVVATASGVSRPTYSRIENARFGRVSVADLCSIASSLALDLAINVYPGPEPLRDEASFTRLRGILGHAAPPLSFATEVPLPQTSSRPYEQRAWDAVIEGSGKRTAVELEMRIRDAQALERRMELKRRDDPVDSFVLLIADSKHNRAILRDHPQLFRGLVRVTRLQLSRILQAGQHPPSCLVLA